MSLGDRLGIAGLTAAFIGIGIAILWPTVRWIGWIAIFVAVGLVICWGVLELKRPKKVPSFVFVFGAPLGDNNSPVWIMILKHYGPNPAYNCDVEFFDKDRKNLEHQWLLQHPGSSFPPPGLAGKSQERFRVPEAGALGSIGSFQWTPLDTDRQHYTASISCRDGVFVETWEVTRVDGVLRTKITIGFDPSPFCCNLFKSQLRVFPSVIVELPDDFDLREGQSCAALGFLRFRGCHDESGPLAGPV